MLLLLFLVSVSIMQFSLAISCARRHPATRVPAVVLGFTSAIQLLLVCFGDSLLHAIHTPSSFDPIGDGFEIQMQLISLIVATYLFSVVLCVWIVIRLNNPA